LWPSVVVTVIEHSPCHQSFEGSSPATATGTGREKMAQDFRLFASSDKAMVELSPHQPKTEESRPGAAKCTWRENRPKKIRYLASGGSTMIELRNGK
jgi:hypothetical protein